MATIPDIPGVKLPRKHSTHALACGSMVGMSEAEFKSRRRAIALDGDRLGPIVGAALALVVFTICLTFRQNDLSASIVRAGWAFVLGYGATFFLVRIILRTTLREFLKLKAERLAARRQAQLEAQRANRGISPRFAESVGLADEAEQVAAPTPPAAPEPLEEEEA